jgi:general secretion pathway protein J
VCSGIYHYSRGKRSAAEGYTLIEVLIATAIFTTMLLLAGMALNQGLSQYQGLVEKGLNFWDYAKNVWIDKSFNSATDYYVYTRSDGWFPYFKGNQEGISYVSLSPFAGEAPVVVWIKKVSADSGMKSLIYYELPVYTKSYEDIDRDEVFGDYKKSKSLVFMDAMDDMDISFYGYDLRNRKYGWYSSFNGNRMKTLPSRVKMTYSRNGMKGSLLFTINVNSLMKTGYDERYPR